MWPILTIIAQALGLANKVAQELHDQNQQQAGIDKQLAADESKTNEVKDAQLQDAAARPRTRSELVDRLRGGKV